MCVSTRIIWPGPSLPRTTMRRSPVRNGARFRRRADEAVFRDEVAARAQAVAIERRAHRLAVGEDERGRAVPRFGETGVIGVEVADVLRQIGRLLPRLRREHGDGVAHIAPAAQQQFDRVVEHGRIAAAGVDDGRRDLGGLRDRPRSSSDSRVFIHARLPCSVLISPLWHSTRNGCARAHVGKVLVL